MSCGIFAYEGRLRLQGHANLNNAALPIQPCSRPGYHLLCPLPCPLPRPAPPSPPGRVPVGRHLVQGGQVDQDGTALRQPQRAVLQEWHLAQGDEQGSSIRLVGGYNNGQGLAKG